MAGCSGITKGSDRSATGGGKIEIRSLKFEGFGARRALSKFELLISNLIPHFLRPLPY
jgi:hypothetical protein